MKILAVGGGSGGHVTPAVAVLKELQSRHGADLEMRFWCNRGFAPQAKQIITASNMPIRLQTVCAGKFRRYSHLTKIQHLLTPSIVLLNVRDVFLVVGGVVQSLVRMLFWRPDVVFAKGGFVCLPVGWAASILRIPIVLHDSDVTPGLTNRLLAGKAARIGTGAPIENYPSYGKTKTKYVGIPISTEFRPYDEQEKHAVREALGFDTKRPLTVVIGGGLGAKSLNDATVNGLPVLLPETNVFLLAGAAQYESIVAEESVRNAAPSQLQVKDFMANGIASIIGAADVVVSRAGATALLELAAAHKPTILVPSSRLVWQVKHAQLFADQHAVLLLDETKFTHDDRYTDAILALVHDSAKRQSLANALAGTAMPYAVKDMADMIDEVVTKTSAKPSQN